MPDEKKHTDRDLILARREGYTKYLRESSLLSDSGAQRMARQAFPLPPQTRPRVVTDPQDPHGEWTIEDGTLRFRTVWQGQPRAWQQAMHSMKDDPSSWAPIEKRVAVWADLFAQPTELVPEEEL